MTPMGGSVIPPQLQRNEAAAMRQTVFFMLVSIGYLVFDDATIVCFGGLRHNRYCICNTVAAGYLFVFYSVYGESFVFMYEGCFSFMRFPAVCHEDAIILPFVHFRQILHIFSFFLLTQYYKYNDDFRLPIGSTVCGGVGDAMV